MDADKKRIWIRGQFVEVTDEVYRAYMDIYAKVKYNKPEQLAGVLSGAFAEWDGGEYEAAQ